MGFSFLKYNKFRFFLKNYYMMNIFFKLQNLMLNYLTVKSGQMKKIVLICLSVFFLVNLFSSCNRDESNKLAYKFKQGKIIKSDKRFSFKFDINQIDISQKNPRLSDSSSPQNQNDSIFSSIKGILSKDDLKSLQFDLTTILTETITRSMTDSAHLSRISELKNISVRADNSEINADESLLNFIKVILSEKQDRKRLSTGEWYNLPRIMGMNLSGAQSDPYIGRLLMFMKNGFALPDQAVVPGYKWDSGLNISIPVDSLSLGQSQGFIDITITSKQELVKTDKKIAEIKIDFQLLVKWDVNIPEEGFSKCEISLLGSGYHLFNIRKGWDFGMFLKGDSKILVNSGTKDKADPGKRIPLLIDATGNFELGSKTR